MVQLNLNPEDLKPEECFPVGVYKVKVIKLEDKENSKGTGRNLFIQFKVIEGKHKGRVIFECFAYDNPNETAVRIAGERLCAAYTAGGGVGLLKQSDDLFGMIMEVQVDIQKSEKFDPKNVIKKFLKPTDNSKAGDDIPYDDEDIPF